MIYFQTIGNGTHSHSNGKNNVKTERYWGFYII